MTVCHMGATWGVQSLCMGSVYLARSRGMHTTQEKAVHTTPGKRQGCIHVFTRIALYWFPSMVLPMDARSLFVVRWLRQRTSLMHSAVSRNRMLSSLLLLRRSEVCYGYEVAAGCGGWLRAVLGWHGLWRV